MLDPLIGGLSDDIVLNIAPYRKVRRSPTNRISVKVGTAARAGDSTDARRSNESTHHIRSRLAAGFALLWAGFLAGVSVLATPVKFTAPSLDLPVALDVGRATFAALNKIEIAAAVALLLIVITTARSVLNFAAGAMLAVLVAAQSLWLLPVLDQRVQIILEGGTPPESNLHMLYVVAEAAKLLVLLVAGGFNLWGDRR